MENEEWRRVVIDDIPFNYEVSNKGRVRKYDTKKLIKGCPTTLGYIRTTITNNDIGYRKTKKFHTLVMDAFVPNVDNLPAINHIDGNKANNELSNLERCTFSHNSKHAFDIGLHSRPKGESNPMSKYTESDIRKVAELLETGKYRYGEISEMTGVSRAVITTVANKKHWNHILDDYDFSNVPGRHQDHSNIHNSIDRAIIDGVKWKEIMNALSSRGIGKIAAEKLISNRRKKIKEGKSIVQCTVYIDEGEEIF